MPFQHEDGTGRDDAVSFGSVSAYKAYKLLRGKEVTLTDDEIEPHLVIATDWIVTNFYEEWRGTPSFAIQALPFPRTGLINDNTGYAFDIDYMPPQLLAATFELVDESLNGALYNAADPTKAQVIEQTVGPITTKYNPRKPDELVMLRNFPYVRDLLRPLIQSGSSIGFRVERR